MRKHAEGLKQALQSVVIPVFCTTQLNVETEKQQKLTKARLYRVCPNRSSHMQVQGLGALPMQ